MKKILMGLLFFVTAQASYADSRQKIQLEKPVPGVIVYTQDGYVGKVNGTFGNGVLSIKIGSSNYNYNVYNIATRGCWAETCTNHGVFTRDGYTAIVNGFFPKGAFSVRIGSSNYQYSWDKIARNGCTHNGRICSGQQVTTIDGYDAVVNGVFPDGYISVKIGSSNYNYQQSKLASR
jgi:hypothetical protein